MKLLQLEKGMKPTLFFYHNLMDRPGRSGPSMVLQKIESISTLFPSFVLEIEVHSFPYFCLYNLVYIYQNFDFFTSGLLYF